MSISAPCRYACYFSDLLHLGLFPNTSRLMLRSVSFTTFPDCDGQELCCPVPPSPLPC